MIIKTLDEINIWSEIKLDIVREYAAAYSRILSAQRKPTLHHVYIDAFAGAGVHISRRTGEFVPGSPFNALHVDPKFKEYHFIDLDTIKVEGLRKIAGERKDVTVYEGDCNEILLNKVFPRVQFKDYRRALCLLDPYGMHLDWDVMFRAGQMKTIDIFLNFPIADMNRNVLLHDTSKVDAKDLARMNAFWGDESWRQAAYETSGNLFGWEEKTNNETIVSAFQKRLKKVAGFKYVPDPMPMRNSNNAVVYYLFFASHKPAAQDIVMDIFEKYRNKGVD